MKSLGNCNGLSGLHLALVLIGPPVRGGTGRSRGKSIHGRGGGGGGGWFLQLYHSSSLIRKVLGGN